MSDEALTKDLRFKDVIYGIEATAFETQSLWERYAKEAKPYMDLGSNQIYNWKQEREGFMVCVGKVDFKPVCISFTFAKINGCRVAFYEPTSMMVDYEMVNSFAKMNFPSKTNAMNFHVCLQVIQDFTARMKRAEVMK